MTPIFLVLAAVTMQPVHEPPENPTPWPLPAPTTEPATVNAPEAEPDPLAFGFPPDAVAVPGLPGAMTHPDVPEGYVLIEGDIQVRIEEYRNHYTGRGTYGAVNFWSTSGTIPYVFAANVDAANQQRAIDAMNDISARAGLFFTPRTNQSDYIRFNASTGNSSPVGRQGGAQTINIVSWTTHFVIIHEIYHSLGFHHEQSRFDRDTYVTIIPANICQTCCDNGSCDHNFEIRSNANAYGFYDFDSFMHYRATDFGINGQTTIVVDPPFTSQWQNAIGQRNHFSFFDEITCRGIYKFSFDRWWKPGASSNGFGNILNPLNHSTFAAAYNAAPEGGVFFIKDNAAYSAIGVYSKAMLIRAPTGASLGN